jgi:CBS domain-containing protein
MKTGYKVCDAMTLEPITVGLDATLKSCAKIMMKKDIGSLLVVDKGILRGIITQTDFVKFAVEEREFSKTRIKDVMQTEVISIAPEKDVTDALELMKKHDIKHLPVVEEDRVLGFLTLKDILKIEPDLFDLLIEKIEIREASRKLIPSKDRSEGLCEMCGSFDPELKNYKGSMVCHECYNSLTKKKS